MAVVHSRLVLCDVGKHTLILNVLRAVRDVSDHVCAHDHLCEWGRSVVCVSVWCVRVVCVYVWWGRSVYGITRTGACALMCEGERGRRRRRGRGEREREGAQYVMSYLAVCINKFNPFPRY